MIRRPNRNWWRRAKTGIEYSLSEGGDVFFILTNADGAKDFKIMQTPVGAPGRKTGAKWFPTSPAG
jgi:oligopeptidase B